jgi:hypothetical protein
MLKKVDIPTKGVRNFADELKKMGHKTSHRMVAELLHDMDYSLQANRKTAEGGTHSEWNYAIHPQSTRDVKVIS